MAEERTEWTEDDSQLYRELASIAVPARDEQVATLLSLLPFQQQDAFRAVELGCGEGALSFAVLDCFPNASVLALDGSESMREQAGRHLQRFGERVRIADFDMASPDWLGSLDESDCVVSSLCVHHLSGPEKQWLFTEIGKRISGRGAVLLADIVKPQRSEAWASFGEGWDRITQSLSIKKTGSTRLFEKFTQEKWNYFHTPDPYDKPSPLFEQLTWFKQAGFAVADCFWLQSGHAIYGGYKSPGDAGPPPAPASVSFAVALTSARTALQAIEQRAGV